MMFYKKDYKNYINKSLIKNYKGVTFFDKKFVDAFFNFRTRSLKYLKKNNKFKKRQTVTKDKTYKLLLNNLEKIKDEVFIFEMYKKFEVNLKLKKSYNKDFIKTTNEETFIDSYLILGILISKIKKINKIQKLNAILKILDKILLKKNYIENCNNFFLINLLNIEKKLIGY